MTHRQSDNSPTVHTANSKCIALFPGAFSPPHAGHYAAAANLASRDDVHEVVVIIANRSRAVPGTDKALGPDLAEKIWRIFLHGWRPGNIRVEIAQGSAVRHALSYFWRVNAAHTLLFCVGETDALNGDSRFKKLAGLRQKTGISARVIAAPTARFTVRATHLRECLKNGRTGRAHFLSAMPRHLSHTATSKIWSLCTNAMRSREALATIHIERVLAKTAIVCAQIEAATRDSHDPTFRVFTKSGAQIFVKYAHDAISTASFDSTDTLKPRRRLWAERAALKALRSIARHAIRVPEVLHFDKDARTLVLNDALCNSLHFRAAIMDGLFTQVLARECAKFLADCHNITLPGGTLWDDELEEKQRWADALVRHFSTLSQSTHSKPERNTLEILKMQCETACTGGLMHLDLCAKNIRVRKGHAAIIDWERCSTIGDPAFDLGTLLGHYVLLAIPHVSGRDAVDSVIQAIAAYLSRSTQEETTFTQRTLAIVGTVLLQSAVNAPAGSSTIPDTGALVVKEATLGSSQEACDVLLRAWQCR